MSSERLQKLKELYQQQAKKIKQEEKEQEQRQKKKKVKSFLRILDSLTKEDIEHWDILDPDEQELLVGVLIGIYKKKIDIETFRSEGRKVLLPILEKEKEAKKIRKERRKKLKKEEKAEESHENK